MRDWLKAIGLVLLLAVEVLAWGALWMTVAEARGAVGSRSRAEQVPVVLSGIPNTDVGSGVNGNRRRALAPAEADGHVLDLLWWIRDGLWSRHKRIK